MEQRRRERRAGDRVRGGILVVELGPLEYRAARASRDWPRDHVGELVRNVEVAAAVVADIQEQIADALHGVDRVDQLRLGRSNMIIEQDIADLRAVERQLLGDRYRRLADRCGHHRNGTRGG